MATQDSNTERQKIEAIYEAYGDGGDGRWSADNPGNRVIYDEQEDLVRQALVRHGRWPLRQVDVLDVGCGSGSALEQLRVEGGATGRMIGLDLRLRRLQECRHRHPELSMMACSGAAIALPDNSIDLALAFTLFSSVLDVGVQRRIASEITRVLRPGGILVWYDLRTPNPANRYLRAMTRRRIVGLFPGSEVEVSSATLLPPLARRLRRHTETKYRRLTRIPLLRSHLVGVVQTPGPSRLDPHEVR